MHAKARDQSWVRWQVREYKIPDFHKNREAAAKLHGLKCKYAKLSFVSSVIEKPMGARHPRIRELGISTRNASQTTGRVSSLLYRQHTLSFKCTTVKCPRALRFSPFLTVGLKNVRIHTFSPARRNGYELSDSCWKVGTHRNYRRQNSLHSRLASRERPRIRCAFK